MKVNAIVFCIRSDVQVQLIAPTDKLDFLKESHSTTDPMILLKVAYKFGKYFVFHQRTLYDESFNDASQMVWYIMKNLDLKALKFTQNKKIDDKHLSRYPVVVGEVVKFGRVAYKVTKIFNPNKYQIPPIHK